MKRWMWLIAAAVAAIGTVVATTSTVQANEEKQNETPVSMDQLPKPARDTLMSEAGGAPIIDVVQETERGQTVYEARIRKGGEVLEIEVDANGKVLKRETEHKR